MPIIKISPKTFESRPEFQLICLTDILDRLSSLFGDRTMDHAIVIYLLDHPSVLKLLVSLLDDVR